MKKAILSFITGAINHFKGLTIIWPTDWTHASRFVPPDDDSISFTINGTLGVYFSYKGQENRT